MIDRQTLEQRLAELPIYHYQFVIPHMLEFSQRVREICRKECPRYGQSWSCPPAVGSVEQCKQRCRGYGACLLIATVGEHERITSAVEQILREQGAQVYTLSARSCGECGRCAFLDGRPCRFPRKMRPCVEGHGILVAELLEPLQAGADGVIWCSLLFYKE